MNKRLVFRSLCAVVAASSVLMTSLAVATITDTDESWNLEKHYRYAHNRNNIAERALVYSPSVRNLQWSGYSFCNVSVPVKTAHDVTDDLLPRSSTCPWQWVINYDSNRSPSTLMVARCTCRHCLTTGSQTGLRQRCRPVHYFRHVTYFPGAPNNVTKLYRLAVGCTCERNYRNS